MKLIIYSFSNRKRGSAVRIGIVGGGAIGLLTAAYLSKQHHVTVYTNRKEQAQWLMSEGLKLVRNGEQETIFVQAKPLQERMDEEEILFIAVKQYHLPTLFDQFAHLLRSRTIVFLQNGMAHIDQLRDLPHDHIILAVVEHGALKQNDTTVIHTGIGQTKWSVWKGKGTDFQQLANDEIDHFSFQYCENWEEMVVKKLLANVLINPLTALLNVRNGQLVERSEYNEAMKLLFEEVTSVLQVTDKQAMWNYIMHICEKTAHNRSSMLRDIEAGRKTEIDAILKYIIDRAQKQRMAVPISQFLYYAVKGKEQEGEAR
jgi:2-dehydropantoate 2-reductase